MFKHHEESIRKVTERFRSKENVLGLIVGGSIAHGFAKENSDVDIMIVISEEEYGERIRAGKIHYYDKEDCTYEDGYVDGKYITVDFMKQVAKMGSEPSRFAFHNSILAFSKIHEIDSLLQSISAYPKAQKEEKIKRFYAQFQAWKWYCSEALKHNNIYLLNHSISNYILFGGRLILAYNETLYPYHKWFLRVLEEVQSKPENLLQSINDLLHRPTEDAINVFYKSIAGFTDWGVSDLYWPNQFMMDSELNWLKGAVPIADV